MTFVPRAKGRSPVSPGRPRGQPLWAEISIARGSPGAFGAAAFRGIFGPNQTPLVAEPLRLGARPGTPSGAGAAGFGHAPTGSRGPCGVPEGSAALVCCTQGFVSVSWVEAPKGGEMLGWPRRSRLKHPVPRVPGVCVTAGEIPTQEGRERPRSA